MIDLGFVVAVQTIVLVPWWGDVKICAHASILHNVTEAYGAQEPLPVEQGIRIPGHNKNMQNKECIGLENLQTQKCTLMFS